MKRYWSRNVRLLLFILLLLGGLLLAAELWIDEHKITIGFYAGVGLLSYAALIVVALLIGKIIKRRDSYYEH